jgi:hypothetical protein
MRACSACEYEVPPEDSFCANCGIRYDPAQAQVSPETGFRTAAAAAVDDQFSAATTTSFHNPTVEAVTAQLDQATQQPRSAQTPRAAPRVHKPMPRGPSKPPPGIVLKTFGGGAGNILLGISLIGGVHSGGTTVFGVLFIILGITTWILGGFGHRPWDKMSPASQRVAGTGAVVGMLFLYVLFFWLVILRWIWRYIISNWSGT